MQLIHDIKQEKCFHCGDECSAHPVVIDDKFFCCEGCRTVYSILQENQLCDYYLYDGKAGLKPKGYAADKWEFLDQEEIQKSLLQFNNSNLSIITLHTPGMHCASCIYLLENLPRLVRGILSAEVNFLKKEVNLKFDPREISLRKVVECMCDIGYTPAINLGDAEKEKKWKADKSLIYRIGIAGFSFGNIMLLSLPEYFDMKNLLTMDFVRFFRWLSVLFTLPVLFYSAWPYFRSAYSALKWRSVNMDLPIALGLAGLAVQSFYNVLSGSGSGYFDSMTGLVFFLLLGRFFQQKTYHALAFDRDYKSYFPLAVKRLLKSGREESIKVTELSRNDVIMVHHDELVPADSILESPSASIDYSFVSGESEAVECTPGSLIYAGGRNKGSRLRLRVVQDVSQSYLTKLWNADAFRKTEKVQWGSWAKRSATTFTIAVIVLSIGTAMYWQVVNPALTMLAVTSVLIVACPCVLALAIPFTFGGFLRVFGRNHFYLKNAEAIEALAGIDTIVFDKTGTLTQSEEISLEYEGKELSTYEKTLVSRLASSSTHPISQGIRKWQEEDPALLISNWNETLGEGVSAEVDGKYIRLGKARFVADDLKAEEKTTYVSVNGEVKGHFKAVHAYRADMPALAKELNKHFSLFILSGDDDKDKEFLSMYFPGERLYFRQSPQDKMDFLAALKAEGRKVLMIGDGLNDAGALKESDFGITVTDDLNAFTPASDAILDARQLGMLPQFTMMAKRVKRVLNLAFIFSGMYNIIGLSFAMRASLEPWVAAILMPLSSITVVLYTHLVTQYFAKKYKL